MNDALAAVAREQEDVLANDGVASLLLGLLPFLERLESTPLLSEALADMLRDADRVHLRFVEHDGRMAQSLRAIRAEIPEPPVDSEAHPSATAGENLRKFDAVLARPV